jgi:hypothetical protein
MMLEDTDWLEIQSTYAVTNYCQVDLDTVSDQRADFEDTTEVCRLLAVF